MRAWRLTTTKTRLRLASPIGFWTRYKSPRVKISPSRYSSGTWYSRTSSASAFNWSNDWLIRSMSRLWIAALVRSLRYWRSAPSMTAERERFDPASRSIPASMSRDSVIEVLLFILLSYYHAAMPPFRGNREPYSTQGVLGSQNVRGERSEQIVPKRASGQLYRVGDSRDDAVQALLHGAVNLSAGVSGFPRARRK